MLGERDVVRLPAWVPEIQWCRTAWASVEAQAVWAPRISAFTAALKRIETEMVYHGLRDNALVFTDAAGIVDVTRDALAHDCAVVPLSVHGASDASYSSASAAPTAGQPVQIRTIVARDPLAWRGVSPSDSVAIARLLGYPECCGEFFARAWDQDHWHDTTIPMSVRGTAGPPEVNILLRWLGVRFVFHLPCSFDCAHSAAIGLSVRSLGATLGFEKEMAWGHELLSMPMRWSSLHGIAEITTPLFKISADTDPLARRVDVDRQGTTYPAEGATGLHFPFTPPHVHRVTASRSYAKAIEHAEKTDQGERVAVMNGFGSEEAMMRAHDNLLRLLALGQEDDPWIGDVLDLGCGDGSLLERIDKRWPTITPHGVEVMLDRAAAAQKRLHWGFVHNASISDIAVWDTQDYALVILMPGRLMELAPELRAAVVDALERRAEAILIYTYDGLAATLRGAPELNRIFEIAREGESCCLLVRRHALNASARLTTTVAE